MPLVIKCVPILVIWKTEVLFSKKIYLPILVLGKIKTNTNLIVKKIIEWNWKLRTKIVKSLQSRDYSSKFLIEKFS